MGVCIEQYRGRIGRFALGLSSIKGYWGKSKRGAVNKSELQDIAMVEILSENLQFWFRFWSGKWMSLFLFFIAIFAMAILLENNFNHLTSTDNLPIMRYGTSTNNFPILDLGTIDNTFPIVDVLRCGDVKTNPVPTSEQNLDDSSDTDSYSGGEEKEETYFDPKNDLKVGDAMPSRQGVIDLMKSFCDRKFTPIRVSNRAGDLQNSKYGRIVYKCTHRHQRKSDAKSDRPFKKINYTGCPAFVNINQNKDDDWIVTKMESKHGGHVISRENYFSYSHVRKLSKDDLDYVQVSVFCAIEYG